MHGCDDARGSSSTARSTTTRSSAPTSKNAATNIHSRTDSETILHLYEERGLDFIHEIEGDYGIAIWDANKERLVLVRDRIGVKPLYFYHKDGRFIFASEIKSILQHPA
jgi:asparagine synthase (glutamine-hydrolysing)